MDGIVHPQDAINFLVGPGIADRLAAVRALSYVEFKVPYLLFVIIPSILESWPVELLSYNGGSRIWVFLILVLFIQSVEKQLNGISFGIEQFGCHQFATGHTTHRAGLRRRAAPISLRWTVVY